MTDKETKKMADKNVENHQGDKNSDKVNAFLIVIKKYTRWFLNFFREDKNNGEVMLVVAVVTTALAIYFGMQLYNDITLLNAKSSQLFSTSTYDIRALQSDPDIKGILKSTESIKDLLEENKNTQSEINKYTDYLHSLQIPYTYLLKYIYLPSLNVWKENYTDKIDTNLIWIKFLENNPYNDITLLQKWGDFFKNLGDNNESNDILDMNIGEFTEDDKWFFSMPITVSFVANSKRAFLLLSDKLSMTSNKENISLINEFFYYLRWEIKKDKQKEIQTLEADYGKIFWSGVVETGKIDQDKVIGYALYNWIFNSGVNTLIDDSIINKTIKNIISCDNDVDEACYYKFRERYRNIPTFGYLLGTNVGSNGTENLKKFMKQLPPIFAIKWFEFDKIKSPTISDVSNSKYKGKITIVVYGRSATTEEVNQIAQVLGNKCLGEDKPITTQDGLALIQSAIVKISNVTQIDKAYADSLWELKGLIENLDKEFPTLSNYKKTIKLFELYRMLSEAGLCK